MAELEALAAAGEDVALVLAAQWLSGTTGSELLGRVRDLHPHAQRGLLIEWGSWGDGRTGEAIFQAMARRQIEYYVIRPTRSPDELFHQSVSTFLLEWAHARRVSPHTVHIVGESWTGRAYELKEVLGRCAVPHAFLLADSPDGRALVGETGDGAALPLVVFPNGTVLADPTNLELASATGATIDPERREFDVVIVGAGPAGLSAAVYGASEGFRTLVVDERRDRRAGDLELADPQLPRLPARRQRSPAGGERLRAGVGLRRQVRLHARRDRDPARRRPPLRQPLRRRRGQRPRGHPRHGRHLSPARGPRARGSGRGRGLLRRPRLRGADDGGRGGRTSSAARTRPARRRCTWPNTPGG